MVTGYLFLRPSVENFDHFDASGNQATSGGDTVVFALGNGTANGTFGTGAYPTSPSPSFGRATAVGDPRQVQFALRLTY